ncbi:MAG TPA: ATP-binding protein [Anaerolineales bacterium]
MKLSVGGLHLQLLALIVLPFSLILLAVALAGIGVHQGAMRQLVAERDERSVRAAATAISEQLHHRQSAVRGLALSAQVPASPEQALQDAAFLFPDFDGGLAITDRQGVVLASSSPEGDWVGRPLHPWIDTLMQSRGSFSSPFVEGGESMVMVGSPADQVLVLGAFSIRALLQPAMLSTMVSSGEGSAYLVDSSRGLLAGVGNSPPEQDLLAHPGVQAALRGEIGSHYLEAADGEHVVAFSQVQPTGWALIVEEPWASVASPMLEISLAAPLILIPALLITLVALWFGARQVIQPLRRLQQQAEDLTDSRYDRVGEPVGGIAEIQQLQATLTGMAQGIRAAHDALQSYIGSITLAQEEERRRLARELHDATIQDLIALDHRIQLIQQQTQAAAGEGPDALEGLRPDIGRSIQELRRLTGALRPIFLEDLGLVPALEMLVKDAQRDLGVEASFQLDGQPRRLGPEAELAIFRIVQEALSNVGRHAEAGQANVRLSFDRETVRVQVQDHGKGFEPPARITELASGGHYGLLGMHERAQLVGAQFSLNSAPGGGTRISVELPL